MKKNYFLIIYGLLLIIFTIYFLLDTFLIERVYEKVETNTNTGTKEEEIEDEEEVIITDNTYQDGNISITITEYREYDTNIYVADVEIKSIDYLKTAFAKDSYGKNVTEKTSVIATRHNAILAINGDYYGVQESGFVLRNGTIYRSTSGGREALVIYEDGSMDIVDEDNTSINILASNDAYQILSFGPGLINNGSIVVGVNDEVDKSMSSNPRTAIAITNDNHYLFIVSDGRTSESVGLSLYELATFISTLDVDMAYNLDGGGSSTMYFNGKIINNPTTNGKSIKERSVSDIVYIGYE